MFDEQAIRSLLAGGERLTVAVGDEAHGPAAQRLADGLRARGLDARVAPEREVFRKVHYPRVWDPFILIHQPIGELHLPDGAEVARQIALHTDEDGHHRAASAEGEALGEDWRQPGTIAVIGEPGFIDEGERFFEPGCRLYVNEHHQLVVADGTPVEVKATAEVRRRWSRPWTRLSSYFGGTHLLPQLPEAYAVDEHLVLLGDSRGSELAAALQASDLLLQVADAKYPGPGKALVSFAWSPFAVEKHAILLAAPDLAGLDAAVTALLNLE